MSKRSRHSSQATPIRSFEETIQNIIEYTPMKKRRINLKTTQDAINFTTFNVINNKKRELRLNSPDMKVELLRPNRESSVSDIFFSMLDN
jgi:hypothetical protein